MNHISWAQWPGYFSQNSQPAWGRAQMFWLPTCPVLSWHNLLVFWLFFWKIFSRMVLFIGNLQNISNVLAKELRIGNQETGLWAWSALLCDYVTFGRALDTAYWWSNQFSLPTSFSPEARALLSSKAGKLSDHFSSTLAAQQGHKTQFCPLRCNGGFLDKRQSHG